MSPDEIRPVAVPWLVSSIQYSGMLLTENEWKTRPIWSYYNPNETKALFLSWGEARVDFLMKKGVEYICDRISRIWRRIGIS